ncbi:MAG: D-alanyl-D-alanine carboxypeptidase family protein [Oscillospiraceae bacterium]|nr:D-alanyl-D-alanine carboxypeptidase family protein [Oscillospiraceae bacterium]
MQRRRLKIRFSLAVSLIVIMSILCILYVVFCRGRGYNTAELPTTENIVAETPAEAPTEPEDETPKEPEEAPAEPVDEPENEPVTDDAEEEPTEAPIVWTGNKPIDMLNGENWALTLINKNYTLDKTYAPVLAPVIDGSSVTADSRVAEAYKTMYNDALEKGFILTPYAGYCSYQRQQTNFENKVQAFVLQGMTREEAELNAEKRVEQGGCSENNAGLAVDIISASAGFASTDEFKWLTENAHNYGFVLRYPDDKTEITGMIYQPWHWRYVGVETARQMKAANQCLEEYLGSLSAQ